LIDKPAWIIWSNENCAWWSPGRRGYTRTIGSAGRYSLEEADEICASANCYRDKEEIPNAVRVLAPEAADMLITGLVDRLVECVVNSNRAEIDNAEADELNRKIP